MTGVDVGSGWDGVVSGRGVEAEGPAVDDALGLSWAERTVPVVVVLEPVPCVARMGLPRVLDRRARRLTGSLSASSPLAR